MDKFLAQKLIDKTREDYNKIADHFSSTRKYIWPDIAKILDEQSLPKKGKVIDLGCGNGRFSKYFFDKNVEYFGLDLSEELIKNASKNNPKATFRVGNIIELPFENNTFDLVLSIATLHHLPGKANRIKAINEMGRIQKNNGKTIISVWYFWNQPKYLKLIFAEAVNRLIGRSKLDYGDFEMDWKDSKKTVITQRYFHAWRKHELRKLLLRNGYRSVTMKRIKKSNNLIVIAE